MHHPRQWSLSSAILAAMASPAFSQPVDDAVAWIKQHAIPLKTAEAGNGFDDLERLKDLIGDAQIVSLGESTHGSREIFQMKHRLVEYLATELGFTIFSIEANMPEAYRLNDYVLRGEGDPKRLIAGMYFWTWNTHEVKDMVEWMRRFNQKQGEAGRRIEFTGFDMQTSDVAIEEVLRFLKKADDKQLVAAQAAYARAAQKQQVAPQEFGVATGTFPVELARGKKVRFSGWIKTEKVDGFAGLWWRVDGPDQKVLAFDNMEAQKVNGTRDWQQYAIELIAPPEATNINFGVIMPGQGTAWFDGLEITLDGQLFQKPEAFDLDFESDEVRGLFLVPLKTYRTNLDSKTAKVGRQSLRLQSNAIVPNATTPEEFRKTVAACEGIHTQLKQARDELMKKHPAKEVDWAIQNARVVVTAMQQRAGNTMVRDAAMAENIAWILEQNPNAKIVLWAHNGHVAKQVFAMGKHLDHRFGKRHLAIGFATSRGEYQAIGKQGLGNHKLQPAPDDSYEAAFERTGLPRFFLDLRQTAGASDAAWLAGPHSFRSIGALAMDQQFGPAALPSLFDAVIYIEESSAARPLR
jgi:erythromycin esterase-like protein